MEEAVVVADDADSIDLGEENNPEERSFSPQNRSGNLASFRISNPCALFPATIQRNKIAQKAASIAMVEMQCCLTGNYVGVLLPFYNTVRTVHTTSSFMKFWLKDGQNKKVTYFHLNNGFR